MDNRDRLAKFIQIKRPVKIEGYTVDGVPLVLDVLVNPPGIYEKQIFEEFDKIIHNNNAQENAPPVRVDIPKCRAYVREVYELGDLADTMEDSLVILLFVAAVSKYIEYHAEMRKN